MAENDDSNPGDSPGDLRTKLEAALKTNSDLQSQMATLQGQVLMPTLNERQRRVVVRELGEDKLDLNAENVKAVAEDLGYKLTPEPPPTIPPVTPPTTPQGEQNGQQQEDGQSNEILVSLSEMGAIDQAQYNAIRGNVAPDFDTKMRNTKSREELRALIRSEGHASGLVHEWDDQ